MPAYDYDDEFNDGSEQGGPKALREALEKVKAELKAANSRIGELESEKTELATKVKSNTLRDALSDAGIDPKYARFAERDGVEPDVENVKKWVEENKDVYAFLAQTPPAGDAGDEGAVEEQVVEDVIPAELREALAAAQGLESSGQPSGSSTITKTLEGVDPSNLGRDELLKLLDDLGAPLA